MITFRRPFQIVKEGEVANAIVALHSHVWMYKQETVPFEEGDSAQDHLAGLRKTNHFHTLKYFLVIDLWVVVIRLEWVSNWKEGIGPSNDYPLPKDYDALNKI